jgi:hypothetical protein
MTPEMLAQNVHALRRDPQRPVCPHCGETPLAPEASELVGRGHVRNFWSCDSCGRGFVTAVRLFRSAACTDEAE